MIPLISSGGLFTRLGLYLGIINSVNTYRGTTLPAKTNAIGFKFTDGDSAMISDLFNNTTNWQKSSNSYLTQLQTDAVNIVQTMVANDALQPANANNIGSALQYVINQMGTSTNTVSKCNVGSTYTANTANQGNGVFLISTTTKDGKSEENAFAEKIVATVIADSQNNGAVIGQETLQLAGQNAETNRLMYDYPLGSGAVINLTACNPLVSNQGGNQNALNDSSFESWTNGLPSFWSVDVGTSATIVQEQSIVYDSFSALRFASNGTSSLGIYQQFGGSATSGSSVKLPAMTQYGSIYWVKTSNTPSSGALQISLTDGNGVIVNDAAGTPNTYTVNLQTIGTTYTPVASSFRTPASLPAIMRHRLKLITPPTSGCQVYIDNGSLSVMNQMYTQGPYISFVNGNATLLNGDNWTINVSNDYAGKFQRGFDVLFNMKALGLLLPSTTSGAATISDSLVT